MTQARGELNTEAFTKDKNRMSPSINLEKILNYQSKVREIYKRYQVCLFLS